MKKNIAVITGGDSSEEVISVKSATLIMTSIDTDKYNVYLVHIKNKKWGVQLNGNASEINIDKNDFSFQLNNSKISFDAAYLIIHGPPAENGKLQAYLDMMRIPYVGPEVMQASLTFNKEVTKQYLGTSGVNSSIAVLLRKNEEIDIHAISQKIGFPCFVKPNEAGSSFGVTKVYKEDQLQDSIKKALTEDETVLIEKFIKGTEVTCGVFRLKNEIHVLPVTEIVSTKDFFDYEAKYTPGAADEIIPARISPELTRECQELTKNIYRELNLTGFSRIDYIIQNNHFYMLEVNTIPGMSPESIVPKMLRAGGYDIKAVITGMIDEVISGI